MRVAFRSVAGDLRDRTGRNRTCEFAHESPRYLIEAHLHLRFREEVPHCDKRHHRDRQNQAAHSCSAQTPNACYRSTASKRTVVVDKLTILDATLLFPAQAPLYPPSTVPSNSLPNAS